ncbi:hypothetical protein, partial [Alloprevotella tannerae]|uniref:hypothetical protein n=1 Tax=Alloprevotella tannerae TaxID=76122 RepID=UPI0028E67BD3
MIDERSLSVELGISLCRSPFSEAEQSIGAERTPQRPPASTSKQSAAKPELRGTYTLFCFVTIYTFFEEFHVAVNIFL